MTSQHEYCWTLLPWFVTGRVSASDAQKIERHLLDCAACRAELEQQRLLCGTIRRDEPVMLAPQASLQKLMARIDASVPEIQAATSTAPSPTRASGRARSWLAVAAGLQAIAIVALLALVWQQVSSDLTAPRFTTLTNPSAIRAERTMVRIVFKPDMTTSQLQSLLRANDAQILAGPTAAGVYTLQVNRPEATDDLTATLARLRGDANVIFAEPVQGDAP